MFVIIICIIAATCIIIRPYEEYSEYVDVKFLDVVTLIVKSNISLTYRIYYDGNDKVESEFVGRRLNIDRLIFDKEIYSIKITATNYNINDNAKYYFMYEKGSIWPYIFMFFIIIGLIICSIEIVAR